VKQEVSKDQQVTHTHTHRQRTTPPTHTHTHTRVNLSEIRPSVNQEVSTDQQVTHTHTHRQRTTPPTPIHTHGKNNTPNPPNEHGMQFVLVYTKERRGGGFRVESYLETGTERRSYVECEVDALGVKTISRGCFERCGSNKKTPSYHYNLSFVTLRTRRPTLLRAPAYRTPSEASPRRRCGHAGRSFGCSCSKAFALTWYRALTWYFLGLISPRTHFEPWKAVGTRGRTPRAAR